MQTSSSSGYATRFGDCLPDARANIGHFKRDFSRALNLVFTLVTHHEKAFMMKHLADRLQKSEKKGMDT